MLYYSDSVRSIVCTNAMLFGCYFVLCVASRSSARWLQSGFDAGGRNFEIVRLRAMAMFVVFLRPLWNGRRELYDNLHVIEE